MRERLRRSDETGETLLELIMAVAILGVAVVAIGSGILVSVLVSDQHRKQTTADYFLHNYAETLQPLYATCSGATPPNYIGIASLVAPAGFNPPSASVKFWDPISASFSSSTCPAADPGLQQVTLTLGSSDGRATESLVVVVRAP
jgi:type II secretory pathway pseudopilin PulG